MTMEIWYRVVVDRHYQPAGICYGQGATQADAVTEIDEKRRSLSVGFELMTGEPQGPFDSLEDAEKAYKRVYKA